MVLFFKLYLSQYANFKTNPDSTSRSFDTTDH